MKVNINRTQVLDWNTFFHPELAAKKPGATALDFACPAVLALVARNLLITEKEVMAGTLGDAIRRGAWPLVDAAQAVGEIASYVFIIRGIILFGMDRKKQGMTQIIVAGLSLGALYLLPGFGGIFRMIGEEMLNATEIK